MPSGGYVEFNDPNSDYDVGQGTPLTAQKKKSTLIFSPFVTVLLFSFINLLAYFDRGALSAVLEDVSDNLSLTETQTGLLGSVFMVGYMIGSPIMAHLVHTMEPFFVFSIGLGVWCASVGLCGVSNSYLPLLFGRLMTGFGEAGFLIIAPPLIDRLAPSSAKSLWLSIFYTAIPAGYALGFALSGIVLDGAYFEKDTWRSIFFVEGLLMLPFVIYGLFNRSPFSFGADHNGEGSAATQFSPDELASPNPDRQNDSESIYTIPQNSLDLHDTYQAPQESGLINDTNVSNGANDYSGYSSQPSDLERTDSTTSSFKKTITNNPLGARLWALFMNPIYLTAVLGYSAQTFVTGGFAFYGLNYAKNVFGASKKEAGIAFGGVTLLSGIVGTLLGGIWLDKWRKGAKIPSAMGDNVEKIQQIIDSNPRSKTMSIDQLEEYKSAILARQQDLHNPNMIKDRLQSIELGYRLVILATSIAIPFALACFLVSSMTVFALLIFVAELALFCCLSVLNAILIWSVPFNLSPQAIAFSVVVVHLLGDALSPLVMGFLLEVTDNAYRIVMIVCCLPLALAVLAWAIGSGKTLSLLNTVRFFKFQENPVFVSEENTLESYQNQSSVVNLEQSFQELQPFVRIRDRLLWPMAEKCH